MDIFYKSAEIIPTFTTFKNHRLVYSKEKLFCELTGDVFYSHSKTLIKSKKNPLFRLEIKFGEYIIYKGGEKQVWFLERLTLKGHLICWQRRHSDLIWEEREIHEAESLWISVENRKGKLKENKKEGYLFKGFVPNWVYPIIFSQAYNIFLW